MIPDRYGSFPFLCLGVPIFDSSQSLGQKFLFVGAAGLHFYQRRKKTHSNDATRKDRETHVLKLRTISGNFIRRLGNAHRRQINYELGAQVKRTRQIAALCLFIPKSRLTDPTFHGWLHNRTLGSDRRLQFNDKLWEISPSDCNCFERDLQPPTHLRRRRFKKRQEIRRNGIPERYLFCPCLGAAGKRDTDVSFGVRS